VTASMTMLAVLNLAGTAQSVLATSGLLAARLGGARIDVLHIRAKVDPSFMPTEEMMSEARDRAFQAGEDRRSSHLQGTWDAWQREGGAGSAATWREVVGETKAVIAAEGSKADLIVIGHAARGDEAGAREAIQAALLQAKVPVVLAPETVPRTAGRHAAIAWKPSEAADQAIQAALPLLFAADRVTVLIAAKDGVGNATPRALAASLAPGNHAFAVHRFAPGRGAIGDVLVREAVAVGADLLVMGAYTHNHLLESLLGGATRDVVAHSALPVLMHH